MSRFDDLRRQNKEAMQAIETGTQRLSTIAAESNRVADIACHA